jgi:hypothetical protein
VRCGAQPDGIGAAGSRPLAVPDCPAALSSACRQPIPFRPPFQTSCFTRQRSAAGSFSDNPLGLVNRPLNRNTSQTTERLFGICRDPCSVSIEISSSRMIHLDGFQCGFILNLDVWFDRPPKQDYVNQSGSVTSRPNSRPRTLSFSSGGRSPGRNLYSLSASTETGNACP